MAQTAVDAHEWVAATHVPLDGGDAMVASLTGIVHLHDSGIETVEVLDVYCARCRRAHDDVAGTPCSPRH